jgi:hypothetical protein
MKAKWGTYTVACKMMKDSNSNIEEYIHEAKGNKTEEKKKIP